jgi:hypothetical protein
VTTPADELRTAADKLAPAIDTAPSLTVEYPNLDACYAHMLRTPAEPAFLRLREPLAAWLDHVALSAVHIHSLFADSDTPDEFIGPQALAVARALNGTEQP